MKKCILLSVILLITIGIIAGCGGGGKKKSNSGNNDAPGPGPDPVGPRVTSISVSPNSLYLNNGQNENLTVTISPANAANKAVTWSSDDDSIVTVDQNGKITVVKAGIATISVTSQDDTTKKATCKITCFETTLTRGNNLGNLVNLGWCVQSGNYIIYSDLRDNRTYRRNAYALSDPKLTLSNSRVSFLNSYNNVIYYADSNQSICSINIDGTNKQVLHTPSISTDSVSVVNGHIYYATDGNKISKMTLSGTGKTTLLTNNGIGNAEMNVLNGWVYYYNSAIKAIGRITVDGKSNEIIHTFRSSSSGSPGMVVYNTKLNKKIAFADIDDNRYFSAINIDGTGFFSSKRLRTPSGIVDLWGDGTTFYYRSDDGYITVVDEYTGSTNLLQYATRFQVCGSYIYYTDSANVMFRTDLVGGNKENIL